MGKKMTRAGMESRRAIRAEIDARPDVDHLELRRKFRVSEGIIESALTKTVAEWDVMIGEAPPDQPSPRKGRKTTSDMGSENEASSGEEMPAAPAGSTSISGIEQGIVKFTRKPAKMGMDFIFWVPRVYVKNGIVDPACEYEVFLKKSNRT
ncbi:MAG: hypothetical protein JW839_11235 [Candidatus Lokiarchaeota archaeon]|nr:hypothetical protein [Candidatus Lokiarchaeota archaeon]